MPPPDLAEMIKSTRDAAAALVEDMHLIRDLAERGPPGPSRAEMRRLSAILRRLVVDDDLQRVASPRVGRIKILARDTKPLVKHGFALFLTVGPPGVTMAARHNGQGIPTDELQRMTHDRVAINTDGFRKQPTICYNSKWLKRLDVIKFIANSLSGVHSGGGERQSEEYKLLSLVRASLTRKIEADKTTTVRLNQSLFSGPALPATYDPELLDPTMLDLLATAEYISTSDDVINLEKAIQGELGLYGPSDKHF